MTTPVSTVYGAQNRIDLENARWMYEKYIDPANVGTTLGELKEALEKLQELKKYAAEFGAAIDGTGGSSEADIGIKITATSQTYAQALQERQDSMDLEKARELYPSFIDPMNAGNSRIGEFRQAQRFLEEAVERFGEAIDDKGLSSKADIKTNIAKAVEREELFIARHELFMIEARPVASLEDLSGSLSLIGDYLSKNDLRGFN